MPLFTCLCIHVISGCCFKYYRTNNNQAFQSPGTGIKCSEVFEVAAWVQGNKVSPDFFLYFVYFCFAAAIIFI